MSIRLGVRRIHHDGEGDPVPPFAIEGLQRRGVEAGIGTEHEDAAASAPHPGVDRVDVRVGRGADVLPTLEGEEAFDLVFIDADKESNTLYLDWAARLGRPGTVVVLDNVVRGGDVADADTTDSKVQGARRGILMLGSDPRFDATALQTLDRKGWDGVALAIVVDAGEAGAGS